MATIHGRVNGSGENISLDISFISYIIIINIRKAKTERVVYRNHTEREAYLVEAFYVEDK